MVFHTVGLFVLYFYPTLSVSLSVASRITKHAYSNISKTLPPKTENFQIKNFDMFHISAQNIDCGYSSNEYPQSMLLSRNKKNNVYPCKPQFIYIKSGVRGGGGQYYIGMFSW